MMLKSGEAVCDRADSHLHGDVQMLLGEALAKVDSLGRQFFLEEIDFGRKVGQTVCVATKPGDKIVYARRPKRLGLTRFVKNRQAKPTSSVVVVLKKIGDDKYEVRTAFVGKRPEPEPWDARFFSQQANPQEAERKAREFWDGHALVWGSEPIIPGTETTVCPW